MTEIHQTLKFGDLPIGTTFQHPKTNEVYTRTLDGVRRKWAYNAVATNTTTHPYAALVHPDTIVTLTSSIDFFSIEPSAKFAYDQKVYTKIARNRARRGTDVKYFEPDDSVSPL